MGGGGDAGPPGRGEWKPDWKPAPGVEAGGGGAVCAGGGGVCHDLLASPTSTFTCANHIAAWRAQYAWDYMGEGVYLVPCRRASL